MQNYLHVSGKILIPSRIVRPCRFLAEQSFVEELRAGERGRHDEAAGERQEREEEVVVAERLRVHLGLPPSVLGHSRGIVLESG